MQNQDSESMGKRLFEGLERLLAQPKGLKQLIDEFGSRMVCDALLSEEEPTCALNAAEIRAMIDGFFKSHPELAERKFEITMTLLRDEKAG